MLALWTVVIALISWLVVRYLQGKKYKLPPGPPGLPFVGNIYQLDQEMPHLTITKWSEDYGDVFTFKQFGRKTVVLNSYEAIYEGLVTKANDFAGRVHSIRNETFNSFCPNIADTTFSPQWVYRKKVTMQTLKMYGDNLKNLELISMDLIDEMIEELNQMSIDGPLDIYPIYHKCVTRIITSVLYGEKVDERIVKTVRDCVDQSFSLLTQTGLIGLVDIFPWLRHFPNKQYGKIVEVAATLKNVITAKINQRKVEVEVDNPLCVTDGLLEHKRKAEENQAEMKLSDDEIYGINIDILLAGTFTTTTTMNATIAMLVNKPEIQQKMSTEIKSVLGDRPVTLEDRKSLNYVEATILEVLRNSTILPLNLLHYTTTDTNVNGFDIPKDTEVCFNLWKLHHNPEYWEDSFEFKPERYLDKDGCLVPTDHMNRKRLLAFGASRRVCIGETLARNRLFLMITSLIQRFEFLPAGPEEIPRHDPRDYNTSFGIEPHHYRVKLVPRK